ncbi:hypothetical protein [Paenibacillus paeoniae]|uniref:Uncharacterized protein n=1 Tax=Paenibacillus paeoniae TaxID=2292705 RepID=A0A371PLE4_9BACL|nr:hypothetical protein [Paenibacillus paeoniae]REK77026.1 hypothetical protein DX130_08450 [Paenibacillus paeoniae]
MQEDQPYVIKRPTFNYTPILFLFMALSLTIMLATMNRYHSWNVATIFFVTSIVLYLVGFITLVLQKIKLKPSHIQFLENGIALYNRGIQPHEIKKIVIQGYFNPSVGIVPKGKRFVPAYLSFAFRDHDEGFKALKAWADQHQIEVKAGQYYTLV